MRRFWVVFLFLFGVNLGWSELTDFMDQESGTTPVRSEPLEGSFTIAHPPEGAKIPAVKSSFVFGQADPAGTLFVNGQSVPIHPGGGWLTLVNYSSGPFTIQADWCVHQTTRTVVRHVTVAGPASPQPLGTLVVTRPKGDVVLPVGETVVIEAWGDAGQKAWFYDQGRGKKNPMVEPSPGLYRGFFVVPADGPLTNQSFSVTVKNPSHPKGLSALSPGRLTRWRRGAPCVLDVTSESAIVRAGPSRSPDQTAGYVLFPPQGTRFVATGRRDFEYRVKLSSTKDGWISVKDVREMPEGTLPPEAVVGTVRVSLSGRHTVVRAALSSPVPFEIRSSDSGRFMDVSFYGAYSDTDWMNYSPSSGTVVRRLEWFQDDTDTYRLRLHLVPSRWWGYDARYQNGTFVLELKSPPARLKGASPLSGLTVAVDPGHSATTGAVGPTGLMEKDANLWIALALEKKLIKEGARVVMLRLENEDVPLLERPKRAVLAGADVFISVHNNSLPEGGNPLETNGYGVYYFTPAGFDLAEKIHRAYGEMFGSEKKKNSTVLRDDGLHYGNLAVIRLTQMPAVLTESAYIILPREEALLKTEMFADGCAEAMTRGLIRFVEEQQVKD